MKNLFNDISPADDLAMVIRGLEHRLCSPQGDTFTLTVDEFTAHRGEIVAVTGPTGSGKTTFLSIACVARRPDAVEEFLITDFRDPAIVERLAGSIFTDLIRDQDRAILLLRMHGLAHAREAAFRTLTGAWDEHVTKMDPGGKQRCANAPGQLTPRRLVDEAIAFLEAKQTPDIKETVAQSTERMRIGSANAERMAGELDDALRRIAQPAG